MNREVPYYEDDRCDKCGKEGAFDFMGDLICSDCLGDVAGIHCEMCGDETCSCRD